LYVLLGSKKGTKVDLQTFSNELQLEMWKNTFKLKEKWLKNDIYGKKFNFTILTDSVGCSIIFKKCKILEKKNITNVTKISSFEKNQNKRKKNIENKEKYKKLKKDKIETVDEPQIPENIDRVYIGIDPGTSSVLTYVTQIKDSKEISKSYSNKEYQYRCHHTHRNKYNENKLKDIKEWMSLTPTSKTMNLELFQKYLNYIYSNENQLALQKFHFKWKTRLKRWNEYIQKQKTIHYMCKEIIDTIPENKECVVAFGDASWNQMKGYSSSPRGKKFYDYLKRNFETPKLRIFSTPEYNTSQICSKCNIHERVVPKKNANITKPHFVRE
jgi:hypothetical protein